MKIVRELFSYGVIGLGVNLVLYVIYIALSGLVDHKISLVIVYVVGVFTSYLLNSRVTFKSEFGLVKLTKYYLVYIVGFLVNLGLLYFLVDVHHYSHELAQFILMFVVAIMLFIMHKAFVFQD